MNKNLLEILSCPLHQASNLLYRGEYFICDKCGKEYPIIKKNGKEIPNFLVTEDDGFIGHSELNSKFLEKVQGVPFKTNIDQNIKILDIGCGENARGNINIDCYIPENIPANFILASA